MLGRVKKRTDEATFLKLFLRNQTRKALAALGASARAARWHKFYCAAVIIGLLIAPGVASVARAESTNVFSAGLPGRAARVVIVEDSKAIDAFRPRTDRIRAMMISGITNLTRMGNVRDAWRSLVSTQDIVGIKVYSTPGPNSGTRPAVVAAVVDGLLSIGIPAKHIIVWDRQLGDLRVAGFSDLAKKYGVRLAGSVQEGYDEKVSYDAALLGTPVWGDLEFGRTGTGIGRKSFVSKLLTRGVTKIINVTPLLNHNLASVSGNLYGLALGSVDNVGRFESEPERLATAVPEIYAMTNLSDRVVLNITDALICQYEGGERGLLHYSTTLNQLRFSRDPVALDVLSIDELNRQRKAADAPTIKDNLDLYHNAALLELGVDDLKKIDVQTRKR
jgi:hypothetical protein